MAAPVYSTTTVSNPKSRWFLVPSEHLDWPRFVLKGLEVMFSLVAFAQEEVINTCVSCSALYFFEFVSCTAFLFTLLLLILLCTPLHERVGVSCWGKLDFCYTLIIFVLFIISSIVFSANNSGSGIEKSAAAFGILASLSFLLDLVLFYRTQGLPFRPAQDQAQTGASSPGPSQVPEAEKLTDNGV